MTNYFTQQPYQQQQFRPYSLKVVPVASEVEINNFTTDFNGIPTYFHNQATNEIVIKQFDIRTGVTSMQKFIKADEQGHEISEGKSKIDINTLDEKLNSINDRLACLEKTLADLTVDETVTEDKGGKK